MRFAHPRVLWILWVTVPLLSWFLWWAWRKKQSLIRQFVQSRLLAHLTVGVSTALQKARLAQLVAAVALLIFTLARPQWGFSWEEAKQRGLDIVIGIDTSRSMLAQDLRPNRLERAKLAALDLMRLAKNDRLGLAAFAGTAFLQCPLTLDEEAFRQSVQTLDIGIIPQGGTALAEVIETATKAFKNETDNHRVVVLFTDGEDHESGALEAAKKAAQSGVKIFTVGVGTANGDLLQERAENGVLSYIKDDQGNVVKSHLNETLLTEIATAAQGFYLPMSGARTVEILYQRGLAPLPKGDISSKLVKQYRERYQWPLALAMVLLLIEMFLPDRKRVVMTDPNLATSPNAELRQVVAILGLCLFTVTAHASPASAFRKFEAGQFKEAEREYQRLLERRPDDPRLQYNAGTSAYQANDLTQAAKHFGAALASPDLDLQRRAYYNLGNSLFRLGEQQTDPPKKIESWEQSVKQYETALKLDSKDADAQFNLNLVREKLEELKKQQDPSKSPSSDKQEKDQNDPKNEEKKQGDKNQPSDKSQESKGQDQPDKKDQPQSAEDPPKDKSDEKKKQEQQSQKSSPQDQKQDQKQGQQGDEKAKKDESAKKGDKPDPSPSDSSAGSAAMGQLTTEQVKQLLDAQKGEEKAMIFIPQEKKSQKTRGPRKEW